MHPAPRSRLPPCQPAGCPGLRPFFMSGSWLRQQGVTPGPLNLGPALGRSQPRPFARANGGRPPWVGPHLISTSSLLQADQSRPRPIPTHTGLSLGAPVPASPPTVLPGLSGHLGVLAGTPQARGQQGSWAQTPGPAGSLSSSWPWSPPLDREQVRLLSGARAPLGAVSLPTRVRWGTQAWFRGLLRPPQHPCPQDGPAAPHPGAAGPAYLESALSSPSTPGR